MKKISLYIEQQRSKSEKGFTLKTYDNKVFFLLIPFSDNFLKTVISSLIFIIHNEKCDIVDLELEYDNNETFNEHIVKMLIESDLFVQHKNNKKIFSISTSVVNMYLDEIH